jgi:C4-dicarboxylate-specific signal transduction histidine kinase
MDQLVFAMDKVATEKMRWGQKMSTGVFLLSLFVVFTQIIWIFLPGLGYLKKLVSRLSLMDALEQQNNKLAVLGKSFMGLAHEVLNPLTYVKTNLELATDAAKQISEENSRARDSILSHLSESQEGADRINSIVSHLRLFGAGEQGQVKDVSLRSVVDQVFRILSLLERDQIQLKSAIPEDLSVFGYEIEWFQIFSNLVLNSIEAYRRSPDLSHKEIQVQAVRENSGYVITVIDFGPGIPSHLGKSIFEPFVSTRTEKPVGLGLALVRELLGHYEAQIDFDPKFSRGAKFIIHVPPPFSISKA